MPIWFAGAVAARQPLKRLKEFRAGLNIRP